MNNKERVKLKNKEIEYEDAPSGYVKLYDYKEPFMEFEGGYGYEGAVLFDGETDKIQCHLCGHWFGSLSAHITARHKMNVSDYKEMVGLRQSTALVNDTVREKLIKTGMDKRMRNLCNRKGKKMSEETKEKIRQTNLRKKELREEQNHYGTCPAQLLDRLRKATEENGGTVPTTRHLGKSLTELLVRTYGSLRDACFQAGLEYSNADIEKTKKGVKVISKYHRNVKNNRKECIEWVRNFILKYHYKPKRKDFVKHKNVSMWEKIRLTYGKTVIFKEAQEGISIKELKSEKTKQYLIDEVIRFSKTLEDRLPVVSDCKRGYLPHHAKYYYYFSSWKNVLKEAKLT